MYKQRLQLLLKSKLNGQNQFQAINSFAVPVIRYTAAIIDWTLQECAELDRFTRKQMTLFKALHPRADVDRLYVNRKKGGYYYLLLISRTLQGYNADVQLHVYNFN